MPPDTFLLHKWQGKSITIALFGIMNHSLCQTEGFTEKKKCGRNICCISSIRGAIWKHGAHNFQVENWDMEWNM